MSLGKKNWYNLLFHAKKAEFIQPEKWIF